MENQHANQEKDWQEASGMRTDQETNEAERNVFSDAGAEDEDIGPVNEPEPILPEENESDNRFMDNEEESGDPLATEEDSPDDFDE